MALTFLFAQPGYVTWLRLGSETVTFADSISWTNRNYRTVLRSSVSSGMLGCGALQITMHSTNIIGRHRKEDHGVFHYAPAIHIRLCCATPRWTLISWACNEVRRICKRLQPLNNCDSSEDERNVHAVFVWGVRLLTQPNATSFLISDS